MAKRKVALGKAIRWSEEQIDEFSVVTPQDIDQLRLLWKRYARLKDLIDAQEIETKAQRGIT